MMVETADGRPRHVILVAPGRQENPPAELPQPGRLRQLTLSSSDLILGVFNEPYQCIAIARSYVVDRPMMLIPDCELERRGCRTSQPPYRISQCIAEMMADVPRERICQAAKDGARQVDLMFTTCPGD